MFSSFPVLSVSIVTLLHCKGNACQLLYVIFMHCCLLILVAWEGYLLLLLLLMISGNDSVYDFLTWPLMYRIVDRLNICLVY